MTTKIHGYKATRLKTKNGDEILTIHAVPIFVECKKGDASFDREWIERAVKEAKTAERDGYLPPLHIRHHEMGTELNDSVRPAGHFRVTGSREIKFKGSKKLAVFADLVVTDMIATADILARRLPYRSVEIFNVDKPALNSLALLDHEAPFLELPMLFVDHVDHDETSDESATPIMDGGFARATFRNPWLQRNAQSPHGVVALLQRGGSAVVVTEEIMDENDQATNDETTPVVPDETKPADASFAADGPPADGPPAESGDGESKEESAKGGIDCAAVIAAIEDGSIPMGAYKSLRAAMDAQEASDTAQQQPNPMAPVPHAGSAPAQAAAPGREAMSSKDDSVTNAKLQARVDALEASLAQRDASDKRRADVDAAMERLDGRPIGDPIAFRAKLEELHEKGPEAFRGYVETFVAMFAAKPENDGGKAATFAAQGGNTPSAAVMKYHEQGSDVLERAAMFSAQWHELKRAGGTRMSEERYIEINLMDPKALTG